MSATKVRTSTQVNVDADLDFQTHKGINLVDPVNPQDAATRAWVLAQVAGVSGGGHTVRAATTGNITLSGTQTIDGIALSAGQLCLVKNQSTQSQNGIYTVASGAWSRAPDMDNWAEVPGAIVVVSEGATQADTMWLSTADVGGTLGSTSITFTQMPGPSDLQAGAGLTRTGQTLDVVAADGSIVVAADNIKVGVSASGAIVGGAALAVNPDNSTIEINANALRVKPNVFAQVSGFVVRETPTGSINGSNVTFTLANTPVSGTEQVFLNGLLQEPGAGNDYTISGATITMLTAPATGDRLKVSYMK